MANSNRRVGILKSPTEFLRLKNDGVSIGVTKWLSLSFLPNNNSGLRVGLTYPIYVGSAVTRNKLKRWSREFLQKKLNEQTTDGAFDVNIFLRRRDGEFYRTLTHEAFDETLQTAFVKFTKFRRDDSQKHREKSH